MINATEIQSLTPNQFILAAHQNVAIPFMILLFIVLVLIFLGIGLMMTNNKEKMFKIWGTQVVFGVIILLSFILLPTSFYAIVNFIKTLFS